MSERMQRLAAEFGGTAYLLMIIVGSGIMGEKLGGGSEGLALLANSIATGAGLYALIAVLQDTGAHFNPAVTLQALLCSRLRMPFGLACMAAQCAGAVAGVLGAHLMFGEPLLQASETDRTGWPLAMAEFVATLGLLVVVSRAPERALAAAVGAYIAAAYWFTASTSFANPAVTLARGLTGTFAGVDWPAVPGFVAAQLAAALSMALAMSWAWQRPRSRGAGSRPDSAPG